jgi:hypothetical protein
MSSLRTTATITGNQISNTQTGITFGGCYATVKNNVIYNNDLGIKIQASSSFNFPEPGTNVITIEQNTIAKNTVGIEYYLEQLIATIKNNNIQDNTQYNFKLDISEDVSFPNNWWGTTSTDQISQKIYDQDFDFNIGKVNYNPILTSPVAAAPAIPANTQTPTPPPTIAPTTQPTQNPTQNPTANPTTPAHSGNQDSAFDLNTVEGAILVVLVVIAVLIAILIVTLRRKR